MRVEFEGFRVIGEPGTMVGTNTTDPANEIQRTLDSEWARAHNVKRTFTELGFSKGRVPDDLWVFSGVASFFLSNHTHTF